MKVLILGDLSISVSAETPRLPRVGENVVVRSPRLSSSGVAANIAYFIRNLGVETYVSGVVGEDALGDVVLRELGSWDVHTDFVRRSARPTSVFMILIDGSGERTMIGYRGASETLHIHPHLAGSIGADWVHVSGYTLLNRGRAGELGELLKSAATRTRISIDLEGIAYATNSLPLQGTTVFCNLEEYRAFFGAKVIASPSDSFTTIVKAGASGSYLLKQDRVQRFEAFKARSRDTNGAGDAFNAAFIYARLKGLDEEEACVWGNAYASLKVSRKGPHPRIERRSMEALIRRQVRRLSSRQAGRYPPRRG